METPDIRYSLFVALIRNCMTPPLVATLRASRIIWLRCTHRHAYSKCYGVIQIQLYKHIKTITLEIHYTKERYNYSKGLLNLTSLCNCNNFSSRISKLWDDQMVLLLRAGTPC